MNSVASERRRWVGITAGVVFGLVVVKSLLPAAEKPVDSWTAWLDEVRPIMTRAESGVFRSLQTEEDRRRFQKLFWEARDPNPKTPQNEYLQEYYARRAYAKQHLRGPDSDRGRMYLILGAPAEKRNFGGYDDIIECEIWSYRMDASMGLPPFLNFIFFTPGNLGDYKQYIPGLHSPLDLLAFQGKSGSSSKQQAYAVLRQRFPDLAEASLSVVPEAGGMNLFESTTSSGHVLAKVFALPERDVSSSYLKKYSAAAATVEVSSSTLEILGWSALAVGEARGLKFLNYTLMPDVLHTVFTADKVHTASLSTILRVEDREGRTVHQQERDFEFRLDSDSMARVNKAKIAFQDFAPIISGEFTVILSFRNKMTDEFFTTKDSITVPGGAPSVLAGFKIRDMPGEGFGPFRIEAREVLADPRGLFTREDVLEGVVSGTDRPDVRLFSADTESPLILVLETTPVDGAFIFHHSLEDLRPGDYRLIVRLGETDIYRRDIKLLSFALDKPIEADKTEGGEAFFSYIFNLGRQHLSRAEPEMALSFFSRIPPNQLAVAMRPTVAKAYYDIKDYTKTIELLATGVPRDYSVLWLLGNSFLELRRFREAAEAFEKLRAYGDTPEKNRTLGAIYYSLGDRDKAKEYWNRAERLEKEREAGKPSPSS